MFTTVLFLIILNAIARRRMNRQRVLQYLTGVSRTIVIVIKK